MAGNGSKRPVEIETLNRVNPRNIRKLLWLTAKRCAVAALPFSTPVLAGGDFGEIRVTGFQIDTDHPDVFELRAVSEKDLLDWLGCNKFTVKGSFDSERWKKYKRPMSATTHQAAIEYLQSASESGETIGFGTMGAGLEKKESCVFESKGLFIEPVAGQLVVFSVHYPI